MTAPLCPVCKDPLPKRAQDRRVAANGIVTCDRASCEEAANDLPPPRPGPRGAAGKAILVRLTGEEHFTLTAAADRSGLGVGPWLRMLGLKAARARRPDASERGKA